MGWWYALYSCHISMALSHYFSVSYITIKRHNYIKNFVFVSNSCSKQPTCTIGWLPTNTCECCYPSQCWTIENWTVMQSIVAQQEVLFTAWKEKWPRDCLDNPSKMHMYVIGLHHQHHHSLILWYNLKLSTKRTVIISCVQEQMRNQNLYNHSSISTHLKVSCCSQRCKSILQPYHVNLT